MKRWNNIDKHWYKINIILVSIGTKYVGVVTLKTIESVELVAMVQIVSSVSIGFHKLKFINFSMKRKNDICVTFAPCLASALINFLRAKDHKH
jgi:hypothetical protein